MNPKAKNIITELSKNNFLVLVETGTIRDTSKRNEEGDGHSTKFIAEFIKNKGVGEFHTIDLCTDICYNYLKTLGLEKFVNFHTDSSLNVLPTFEKIDFAYLDSANDPELILNEFLIVWPKITKHGLVMADDCCLESIELKKGHLLIPYLEKQKIEFKIDSSTHQLFIYKRETK